MTAQHTPGAGILIGLMLGAVLWVGILWVAFGHRTHASEMTVEAEVGRSFR